MYFEKRVFAPTFDRARIVAVCTLIAGIFFWLDMTLPLGVAGGVPYVVVVLVSLWSHRRNDTLLAAGGGTLLTVLGFFLSPAGGVSWVVLLNRFYALVAIWFVALLGLQHKEAEDRLNVLNEKLEVEEELRKLNDELERRVEERTADVRESEKRFHTLASLSPVGIFRTGGDGNCIYVNERWEEIAGLSSDEALGDGWTRALDSRDRERVIAEWESASRENRAFQSEYRMQRPDGTVAWVFGQAVCEPPENGRTKGHVGTITDITERKRAEKALESSVKQKQALLQEIHHRVKNNLQVVSSLLYMCSRRVEDEVSRQLFKESQDRIRSIALVHETLCQSDDLARLDFAEYVRNLGANLFDSYGIAPSTIRLAVDVDDGYLGIDTAIPCSLIVSELIVNALKYAFPDCHHGEISVALRRGRGNWCHLAIADDGIGLPESFDLESVESLGLCLVRSLTEQIGGTLTIGRDAGTSFDIHFQNS